MLTVNIIQPKSLNVDGVHCLLKELIKINYKIMHWSKFHFDNVTKSEVTYDTEKLKNIVKLCVPMWFVFCWSGHVLSCMI